MWMHFLVKAIPAHEDASEEEERAWFRMAFYLQWHQTKNTRQNVRLVCFGALKTLEHRFTQMRRAQDWEAAMENPYILVAFILESWHERVDRIVWRANDRGSVLENVSLPPTIPWNGDPLHD
jgi:hypothetical protein